MNKPRLLKEAVEIVKSIAKDKIVSLFLMGSFGTKDQVSNSDVDICAVMAENFDFAKEREIQHELKEKIEKKYGIETNFHAMSIGELYGREKKGTLTEFTTVPVFLNFVRKRRMLSGKDLDYGNFPIKRATPREELKFHIGVLEEHIPLFRKQDFVAPDWHFKDFIKTVFYIADIENQIVNGAKPIVTYSKIEKAYSRNPKHLVHFTWKLRRAKKISQKNKQRWLGMAEKYLQEMRKLLNS
jgi:predicted nucleotidyltransferase